MSSIELTATIKAVDDASEKIKKVGDNTEKAMKKVEDSTKKADFSFKQFAVSISGVMTAGFALYNAYDRIQDAQLAVTKAQNTLTSAQISAKDAQEAYNKAVEKYGVDSDQARDALEKLELAQDRVKMANETLTEKQSRVNEAMAALAVQAIPSVITMVSSLRGAYTTLTGSTIALSAATKGLAVSLGLIGAAVTIIGTAAYVTYGAIQETAEFKKILEALGLTMDDYNARTNELVKEYGSLIGAADAARKEIIDQYNAMMAAQEQAQTQKEVEDALAQTTDSLSVTLTDLAMSNEEVVTASLETMNALQNVDCALGSLETTVGGMPSFWSEKFEELSSVVSGWASSTIAQINTVVEAFRSAQEEIVGGSIWPDMWKEIERVTKKGIEANISLIGKGLETIASPVSPIAYHASPTINITSPLIAIQGSADKRTVELAANMVMKRLRSVVIESTSSASSLKRVRRR